MGQVYDIEMNGFLEKGFVQHGDFLFVTNESKKSKNKIIRLKQTDDIRRILLKFLQNIDQKLDKNTAFLEEDLKLGINFNLLFEGRFN